jgi:hypothetical protein
MLKISGSSNKMPAQTLDLLKSSQNCLMAETGFPISKGYIMATRHYSIALLCIFACITNAKAGETNQPKVIFDGFGSLGVSHSSMHMGDYTLDSTIPKGAGLSEDWSTTNDTRIAGHLVAQFTPKVSAVLQVVSEYTAENTFQPEVEWANVKYAFTPDTYIRIGRIVLPTFLDSDNRDVGYTYVWIHPPLELYRQVAITHSDGIDAMYHVDIGKMGNTIKSIIYGENTIERPTGKSISKDMWGIFDTIEYGPATAHVGYQERLSASQDFQTGLTGAWVRNSNLSVGMQYDPGNWFVMSEWLQRKSTTKISAMYISAGYRIKKFTPYLTYSQNSPGSFLQGSPTPSSNSLRLANRSQSTVSLGVRWDFRRNTDFKLQYDQVKLSDNSNGYLANVPPNVSLYGSTFHVITAVVDFVF